MKVINCNGWDYYCAEGNLTKVKHLNKITIINQLALYELFRKIEPGLLPNNIGLLVIEDWMWSEVMPVARSRVYLENEEVSLNEEATLQSFNGGKGNDKGNDKDADKDNDKAYTQTTPEDLPALHKTESHTAAAEPPNSKADFDDTAMELIAKYILLGQKELAEEKEKTQTLKAVNSYLAHKLMSLQTKTDHYHKPTYNTGHTSHTDRTDHFTETSIKITSMLFGIKWERFMAYLSLQGYLYKDETGTLLPYDRYLEQGLFTVKCCYGQHCYNQHCCDQHCDMPHMQTMITSKGRDYFRSILMDDGTGEINGLGGYKRMN